jgi:hypothetical protein
MITCHKSFIPRNAIAFREEKAIIRLSNRIALTGPVPNNGLRPIHLSEYHYYCEKVAATGLSAPGLERRGPNLMYTRSGLLSEVGEILVQKVSG